MTALSPGKQAAIAALVCAAPDGVLVALERAFANAPEGGGAAFVRAAVSDERRDRRARAVVFEPVIPLFRPRPDGLAAPSFPPAVLRQVWNEIRRRRPDGVAALEARIAALEYDETVPPAILDGYCAEAAAILREGDPGRWSLSESQADELAALLDLAPLARRALPHLGEWLARLTDDRVAAMRLVFRDATAVADDATPRLMEIFLAHVPEAHLILRLFPAMTHGAGEGLVAVSELAPLGERLLEDAERRLERAERFSLRSSPAEVRELAADLGAAGAILTELEACLELSRDGQWGRRVAAGRARANGVLERGLRQAEAAVARALPTTPVRIAGRVSRQAPNLEIEPAPEAVDQARAVLTLVSESRNLAQALGCGGLRAQVCEGVGERLDNYVEDLLTALHEGDLSPAHESRARAMIEIAAEHLGLLHEPAAERLVRRRLASVAAGDAANGPSQARA